MKAVLDTLDGIPDLFKTEYLPVSETHPLASKLKGKFILKVDPHDGVALEDVQALKSTLAAVRTEKEQMKAKIEELGPDFNLAEAREALTKVKEMSSWTPDDKVNERIEGVKKQLGEKAAKTESELKAQIAKFDSEIAELLIDQVATQAIADAKGSVRLLLPHVKSQCKVVRDANNKPVVHVLQPDGKNPRITAKTGSTENMSIPEFVESLKTDDAFKPAFVGTGVKGTGAAAGTPNGQQQRQQPQQNQQQPPLGNGDGSQLSAVDRLKQHRREEAGAA